MLSLCAKLVYLVLFCNGVIKNRVIFQSQFILNSGSFAMPELRTNGQFNGHVFYVLIHHFSEQETNLRGVCAFWGNFV